MQKRLRFLAGLLIFLNLLGECAFAAGSKTAVQSSKAGSAAASVSAAAKSTDSSNTGAAAVSPAASASEQSSDLTDYEQKLVDNIQTSMAGSAAADVGLTTTKPTLPSSSYTEDFTWSGTQTLHGLLSTVDLYFNIPKYWDVKYTCMNVQFNLSEILSGTEASLTFIVNNTAICSHKLDYSDGQTQNMYFDIPTNQLKVGYNHLEIDGYVKLYDSYGCLDSSTAANWVNISSASFLRAGYDIKPYNNEITAYPFPFISTVNPTGSTTNVLVSDMAADGEIAAASVVSAYLGGKTTGKNSIGTAMWSDRIGNGNYIFVGLTGNVPAELKNYVSPYESQISDRAVLVCTTDSAGNHILMIVSDNDAGLMEGARMLADDSLVMQQTGNVAFAVSGAEDKKENAAKQSGMISDEYTLDSLSGSGLSFVGESHQKKVINLPVTSDYTLSSTSKVTLHFRYSKNLDFDRSMLTVYFNDLPVASKKLEEDKTESDELSFSPPADMVNQSISSISFAFDLELKRNTTQCGSYESDMPWAYILSNSSMYFPNGDTPDFKFDNKPSPFMKNGELNKVLIVLPDDPTSKELNLLGRFMAYYASGASSYSQLTVKKGSELTSADSDYNIITVGTYLDNGFIRNNNKNLFFQYNDDGSAFQSNEKLVLSDSYAKTLGTMQFLKSPYQDGRALLVLAGPDGASLDRISVLISTDKLNWNIKNDCVIIDNDKNIFSYRFKKDTTEETKPGVLKTVLTNKQSSLFVLTAAFACLVLLLALLLVLIRLKIRRDRDKKDSSSTGKS